MPTSSETLNWFETAQRIVWRDTAQGYITSAASYEHDFLALLPTEIRGDFARYHARFQEDYARFRTFMDTCFGEARDDMPRLSFEALRGCAYAHDDPYYWGSRMLDRFISWYCQRPSGTVYNRVLGIPWWLTSGTIEPSTPRQPDPTPRSEIDTTLVQ